MIVLGIIYIVAMAVIFAFVLFRHDHTIGGVPGQLSFTALFASGLALAVHAL